MNQSATSSKENVRIHMVPAVKTSLNQTTCEDAVQKIKKISMLPVTSKPKHILGSQPQTVNQQFITNNNTNIHMKQSLPFHQHMTSILLSQNNQTNKYVKPAEDCSTEGLMICNKQIIAPNIDKINYNHHIKENQGKIKFILILFPIYINFKTIVELPSKLPIKMTREPASSSESELDENGFIDEDKKMAKAFARIDKFNEKNPIHPELLKSMRPQHNTSFGSAKPTLVPRSQKSIINKLTIVPRSQKRIKQPERKNDDSPTNGKPINIIK